MLALLINDLLKLHLARGYLIDKLCMYTCLVILCLCPCVYASCLVFCLYLVLIQRICVFMCTGIIENRGIHVNDLNVVDILRIVPGYTS